jgi:uncharacterized integral membrane protein
MPDFNLQTWILIGVAGLIVIGLIITFASRAGRKQQEHEQKIRRSQTVRITLVVVLLGLIVLFAVANSHTVGIDWVVTETRAPMVLVIGLSAGVGFLVGALVASRHRPE